MGAPMARNLLRAGHEVIVHGRSAARVDPAGRARGAAAARPRPRSRRAAEAVLTSLPDGPDVELVVHGPEGVLAGAARGLVVIDTSTIAPRHGARARRALRRAGVRFLDAPVSGGEQGAIAGTLSIMAGGDADVFDAAPSRCSRAIGRTVDAHGGAGQGQMTKLVNQVIGVTTLAAVAEGLTLGAHAGLEPATLVAGGRRRRGDVVAAPEPRTAHAAARLGARLHGRASSRRTCASRSPRPRRRRRAAAATAVVHQLFAAVEARGGGALGTQAIAHGARGAGGPARRP